jgi:hypothetical protein
MNDSELRSLLAAADVADRFEDAPPMVAQLQARLLARRRRLAIAGGAAIALVAAWIALPHRDGESPDDGSEVARVSDEAAVREQLLVELSRLDREADQAVAVARRLQMARRVEQARGESLGSQPLIDSAQVATEHIDRTVMTSVAYADRLQATLGESQPAVELYRHVLNLFPNSRWSAVARQRIETASTMN